MLLRDRVSVALSHHPEMLDELGGSLTRKSSPSMPM